MIFSTVKTEKHPDYLETMARNAEPAALSNKDRILAAAVEEHKKDKAAYKFDCRRFGDFLTIFIDRGANPDADAEESKWWAPPPRKFSTSINLSNSKTIRLIQGYDADSCGTLKYRTEGARTEAPEEPGWVALEYTDTYDKKTKTYWFKVEPEYPDIPSRGRQVFYLDPPPDPSHGDMVSCGWRGPQYTTKDYPRPAKDDAIRFTGTNATIYAPAGMGQMVYDEIMNEIAEIDAVLKIR